MYQSLFTALIWWSSVCGNEWKTLTVAVMEKDASFKSWGFITAQTFNPVLLAINIKDLKPLKTQCFTFFHYVKSAAWSKQNWIVGTAPVQQTKEPCLQNRLKSTRSCLSAQSFSLVGSSSLPGHDILSSRNMLVRAGWCFLPSPFCPNVWQRRLVWECVILKMFKLQGQLKHQSDQSRCFRRNGVKIIE